MNDDDDSPRPLERLAIKPADEHEHVWIMGPWAWECSVCGSSRPEE